MTYGGYGQNPETGQQGLFGGYGTIPEPAFGTYAPRNPFYTDTGTSALRVIPPSGFAVSRGLSQPNPSAYIPGIVGLAPTPRGGFAASRPMPAFGGVGLGTYGANAPGFVTQRQGWYGEGGRVRTQYDIDKEQADARASVVGQGQVTNRPKGAYFDAGREITDVVQDQWQTQYDRYIAGMQAEEDAVSASAQAGIEAAEDELGDLRAAAAAVGMPFDEYIKARQAIGADVGEAGDLSPSMRPVVSRIYDSKQGEMKRVLKQIDMNFGPKVAASITGRLDEFENVIQDVIRTDESAIDLLHEKKGQYAKAMAQAAYSTDVYAALDAETKINAQLDKAIEETAEDLARQKRARDAAIKAAQDQYSAAYEWQEPDAALVTGDAWTEYFEANNIPEHMQAAAMSIYEQLKSDPANTGSDQAWRKAITEHNNLGIFASMGYTPESIQQRINDSENTQLFQMLNNRDMARMFQSGETKAIQAVLSVSGFTPAQAQSIVNQGLRSADSYTNMMSPEVKHLKQMRSIEQDVLNNWDQYIAAWGPTVSEEDVYRAPNGYVMPVAGGAKFSHDWGNPRSGGRTHEGIDLFAAKGTPVLSPVDGTVVGKDIGELGGNYLKIKDSSGRIHYLAHLDGYARNVKEGMRVRAGMMVGMVGNTGNARTTPPHLHYGIYGGGGAIDPYYAVSNAMKGKNPTYSAGTSQSISNYQGKEKRYTYRL